MYNIVKNNQIVVMKTVRTPYILTISYSHMLNERWKNKSGKTDCVIHLDPAPPPPLTYLYIPYCLKYSLFHPV